MRMSAKPFLVLVAYSIGNLLLSQAPPQISPADPIITTVEMRKIAGKEFAEADEQLNKVYAKLLARLDASQKLKLRMAQRAWLKYRDENATFEASFFEGGSIQPQIYAGSLTAMTANRTKELQQVLDTAFDH